MNINTSRISTKNCYVNSNNPKYIVIHETDNYDKGANAERHAIAQSSGNLGASVHYYVDDHSIYKTLEHYHGAWAVGDGEGRYGITNRNTINIEICVNPDNDYEKSRINCIELVKYLMQQTGIPADRVVRHYDASRKPCPRKMIDKPNLWEDFKSRIQGKSSTVGQQARPQTPVSKIEPKKTWEINIQGDIIRRLQGELNIQFGAGIKVDGYAGDNTVNKLITVRSGARGNITKIIQELLIRKGYNVAHGADGIFGNGTKQAVMDLQRKYGLSTDGIVGKNTWKALLRK